MENFLIDTNVLIYAINNDSEFHQSSRKLFETALNNDLNFFVSINNLLEFFAIVTDNKRVQNPLTPNQAREVINIISESKIKIIHADIVALNKTLEIAVELQKSKQVIFDFLIAAIMISNDIKNIITYNTKDFKSIAQIKTYKPEDVDL
ncbi:MAG: type II toxin-antitoxin system VapC family toxin [Candidatus Kapabacteria bacterium]|jgi:predicted nucleic acid-binding protein|nr:type II toxin-antitoxin system VapC family toxin [Candidatus Kapabacteria bacterium]